MSGMKQFSRGGVAVAVLIAAAWAVVLFLLLQFYYRWEVLQAIGRFMLSLL